MYTNITNNNLYFICVFLFEGGEGGYPVIDHFWGAKASDVTGPKIPENGPANQNLTDENARGSLILSVQTFHTNERTQENA